MTIVKKTENLSIYFLTSQGYINNWTHLYSKRISQPPGTRRASRRYLSMFKKIDPKRARNARWFLATYSDARQTYPKRTQRTRNAFWTCLRRVSGVCGILQVFQHVRCAFHLYANVWLLFYFCSKHRLWVYTLEPPRQGGSNEYPQSMFWSKIRNIPAYLSFAI